MKEQGCSWAALGNRLDFADPRILRPILRFLEARKGCATCPGRFGEGGQARASVKGSRSGNEDREVTREGCLADADEVRARPCGKRLRHHPISNQFNRIDAMLEKLDQQLIKRGTLAKIVFQRLEGAFGVEDDPECGWLCSRVAMRCIRLPTGSSSLAYATGDVDYVAHEALSSLETHGSGAHSPRSSRWR